MSLNSSFRAKSELTNTESGQSGFADFLRKHEIYYFTGTDAHLWKPLKAGLLSIHPMLHFEMCPKFGMIFYCCGSVELPLFIITANTGGIRLCHPLDPLDIDERALCEVTDSPNRVLMNWKYRGQEQNPVQTYYDDLDEFYDNAQCLVSVIKSAKDVDDALLVAKKVWKLTPYFVHPAYWGRDHLQDRQIFKHKIHLNSWKYPPSKSTCRAGAY